MKINEYKIFENYSEPIVILDNQSNIIFQNNKFDELLVFNIPEKIEALIKSKIIQINEKIFEIKKSNLDDSKQILTLYQVKDNSYQNKSNKTNEYLNEILNNPGVFIYHFNYEEDKYEYISNSTVGLLGYEKPAIKNYGFQEILSFFEDDEWKELFDEAQEFILSGTENRKHFVKEYRIVNNGKIRWIRDSLYFHANSQKLSAISGIIIDITEYKNQISTIDSELIKKEKIINSVADCLITINLISETVTFDEKSMEFFKLNSNSILFSEFNELFFDSSISKKQLEKIEKNYLENIQININNKIENYYINWIVLKKDEVDNNTIITGVIIKTNHFQPKSVESQFSHDLFDTIFKYSLYGIALISSKGDIVNWNPSLERITGFKKSEVEKKKIWKLQDMLGFEVESDINFLEIQIMEVLRTGNAEWLKKKLNTEIFRKDGTKRFVEFTAFTFKKSDKYNLIYIFRDITAEKINEIEMSENEEKFRQLVEGSNQIFYVQNLNNGKYEYISPNVYELMGYTASQFSQFSDKQVMENVHPDDLQDYNNFHDYISVQKRLPENQNVIEYRFKHSNGDYKYLSDNHHIIYDEYNTPLKILGTLSDISKRKKIENQLIESRNKYRILIENQSEMIVIVDKYGIFKFANQKYCATFGKDESDLIGNNFMPLVHEEDRLRTSLTMEKLKYKPYECYIEQRAKTKDGWRWLAWNDKSILDKNGEIKEIIGVGRDITNQKKLEKAMTNTINNFENIIQGINSKIVVLQKDYKIIFVNTEFENYLNSQKEYIVGHSIEKFVLDFNNLRNRINNLKKFNKIILKFKNKDRNIEFTITKIEQNKSDAFLLYSV